MWWVGCITPNGAQHYLPVKNIASYRLTCKSSTFLKILYCTTLDKLFQSEAIYLLKMHKSVWRPVLVQASKLICLNKIPVICPVLNVTPYVACGDSSRQFLCRGQKVPHFGQDTTIARVPTVLWRCWLDVRKGIWPVKLSAGVLAWLSVDQSINRLFKSGDIAHTNTYTHTHRLYKRH